MQPDSLPLCQFITIDIAGHPGFGDCRPRTGPRPSLYPIKVGSRCNFRTRGCGLVLTFLQLGIAEGGLVECLRGLQSVSVLSYE